VSCPPWQYNSRLDVQADSTVAHLAGGQVPVALRGGGRADHHGCAAGSVAAHGTAHGADERADREDAGGLAEADHVARQMEAISAQPSTRPTTGPTTAPAFAGRERAVVNLILLSRTPKGLSRFETRALEDFKKNAEIETVMKRQENKEGPTSFKYARALVAQQKCMACHADDLQQTRMATRPNPPLLGMVSIEIPYQVDAMQIFLNRIFIFLAGCWRGRRDHRFLSDHDEIDFGAGARASGDGGEGEQR